MKVSLNWLKEYIELDYSPQEISEILTDIGLEVEGMETIETIKGGLEGIVVGHVTSCEKHPNADKLSLCKVNIGRENDLQIVCGAPNVAEGQKVLVANIGTTLYTPKGEAWKIKKGKIRGEASEGMICAEDELGLGDDHSGIVVLPPETEIGALAKEIYEVNNDVVYEIGLTPNRSDATSHIGVAEDLAAYLKINKGHSGNVKYPDSSDFKEGSGNGGLTIDVIDKDGAPRYSGILLENIEVKESPDWLKNALRFLGMNPKSNIVDITNFILHEFGQPLHAFDADKISGQTVKVQTLPEGSPFKDLEGKDRSLSDEDVMICDGNDKGMCIGGVFGGIDSGVTENTKRIFLESAHFNARRIRRTSTRHLLRTDAAVCFEKGSDPNITLKALKRAVLLMQDLAGANVASRVFDIYPEPIKPVQVKVKFNHITRLIGEEIPKKELNKILDALHINVVQENDTDMLVEIPTNKSDVTREADVIEEILRIYGFNKVGIPEKVISNISYQSKPDKHALRNKVANLLCGLGFSEMMAISLNEENRYSDDQKSSLVYINNTSNIHLNVMRADMAQSALDAISYNLNRQETDIKLFEFGKIYSREEESIREVEMLSLALTGSVFHESWIGNPKNDQSGFFYLKSAVNNLLDRIGVSSFQISESEDPRFLYGIMYHRGPSILAEIGMLNQSFTSDAGVKQNVNYAELNWNKVIKAGAKNKVEIVEMSKFPKVRRDLALVINEDVKFDNIESIAFKTNRKILQEVNLFDVYKNEDQLGKGKKSYAVSFIFQDADKTLKDKDVDKVMNVLIRNYEKELEALIRK